MIERLWVPHRPLNSLIWFSWVFTGQPVPPQLWHKLTWGKTPGFKLGVGGSATQTSMEEAWRRQRDDSDGTSWRLISLPSSRSVCSLEKLVTSITLQKLPRVNSGGTGQWGGWRLTSSFQERSSASTSAWGLYENKVNYVEIKMLLQGFNSESIIEVLMEVIKRFWK